MSVKTNNIYGKILISDKTIARFTKHVAMDCYGIVSKEYVCTRCIKSGKVERA